jgi:flagellin
MGLRINTNIASVNAQRNLADVTAKLGQSYRRLSTGLRISVAADDAAGLAISERLRSQIQSLGQAKRNANDAISMVQVGEGALNEVSNMLTRLRVLAIQSANGSTSAADKNTIQEEFAALVSEINRIAQSTEFNGVRLLDGSASVSSFQVGINSNPAIDQINISLSPALATTLGLSTLDVGSAGNTSLALAQIDTAITSVASLRGRFGAVQNRMHAMIASLAVASEGLSAAESRIRDVDIAAETSSLTRNTILQQAAIAILAQANAQPQVALTLLQ